ncbi:hypothetical protein ANN_06692 [Periplaneta americana]|uniref:Uncharacterized protein n=1 Tax=Periplaneta americana TaxID=6978 RepID=A0ABQ8TED8_PERAM|nr:hypothetical protein ANN_06692 [Periplaneta americana]
MSPGSSTESYSAFAHIGLRENPGKNLNQVTCPDRESNPGHLVSQPDVLTVTPQVWTWTDYVVKFFSGDFPSRKEIIRYKSRKHGLPTTGMRTKQFNKEERATGKISRRSSYGNKSELDPYNRRYSGKIHDAPRNANTDSIRTMTNAAHCFVRYDAYPNPYASTMSVLCIDRDGKQVVLCSSEQYVITSPPSSLERSETVSITFQYCTQ